AHVRDLRSRHTRQLGDPLEEERRRLLDAEPLGRRDEGDLGPEQLLVVGRHVPDGADDEAALAQAREARHGVGVPRVLEERPSRRVDPEQLQRIAVGPPCLDHRPDERHEREARHPARVGGRLPVPRLVDQGLADVEDDGFYSHPATRSRSAFVVTFSSRSSPSTIATRPPTASTSEAQSVPSDPARASASRSTGATNACGVCTATSSERAGVSVTNPPATRLIVSATGSAGTAPSEPWASASSSRGMTSSGSNGRAASWTRIAAASRGTSATPARTESV